MLASPFHAQPCDEVLQEDLPKGIFYDAHPVVLAQHIGNGFKQPGRLLRLVELHLQRLDVLLGRERSFGLVSAMASDDAAELQPWRPCLRSHISTVERP